MISRRKFNHVVKADFNAVKRNHIAKSIRAIIYKEELYIIFDNELENFQSREFAILYTINRALLIYPDRDQLPNCEFKIYVDDMTDYENDSL